MLEFDDEIELIGIFNKFRDLDTGPFGKKRMKLGRMWGNSVMGDPFAVFRLVEKPDKVIVAYLPNDYEKGAPLTNYRVYDDLDQAIGVTLSKWDLLCKN